MSNEIDLSIDYGLSEAEVQKFNGKVLVIWWGGREHAMAWKIAQSRSVTEVFVASWNAGTAKEDKVTNIEQWPDDINELLQFAKDNKIWLTVVGPEVPLTKWIVDMFREAWLRIVGPSKVAAQLEWSKDFTKRLLVENNIPTAKSEVFTELKEALNYIWNNTTYPIVIKADGLAAGKWVIIAKNKEEAENAVTDMMEDKKFGSAGEKILIEEFLEWEEVSFIVMVDKEGNIFPMSTSQDNKTIFDGNTGPNTWWMWASSPAPIMTEELTSQVMDTIIKPTVEWMKKNGTPFTWFLYAGLMITKDWPKVLEFNVRMGDPETQPILTKMKEDFVDLLLACADWTLDKEVSRQVEDTRASVTVVMSAAWYPWTPRKWDVITWLDQELWEDEEIFHSGTALNNKWQIVTNWWRVLSVTAVADTIEEARERAYAIVDWIYFEGMYFRRDIGDNAINREK